MVKKKKQVTPAKKITRRKNHMTAIVFWICLMLVLAPFCVLGWLLLSSYMDSSAPVFGNRYEGDLDPAITAEQIAEVEQKASALESVEGVKIEMATATLRVYADIPDDAGKDTAKEVADQVYTAVSEVLDPSVYFTQADGKKMYDLEVHVYNLAEDRDSDAFVYVIGTKTSSMESMKKQVVSEPIDAELAQSLRDAVVAREEAAAAAAAEAEAEAAAAEGNDDDAVPEDGEDGEDGEDNEG